MSVIDTNSTTVYRVGQEKQQQQESKSTDTHKKRRCWTNRNLIILHIVTNYIIYLLDEKNRRLKKKLEKSKAIQHKSFNWSIHHLLFFVRVCVCCDGNRKKKNENTHAVISRIRSTLWVHALASTSNIYKKTAKHFQRIRSEMERKTTEIASIFTVSKDNQFIQAS